eukprot:3077646-Prymnesium_polylepis.1
MPVLSAAQRVVAPQTVGAVALAARAAELLLLLRAVRHDDLACAARRQHERVDQIDLPTPHVTRHTPRHAPHAS